MFTYFCVVYSLPIFLVVPFSIHAIVFQEEATQDEIAPVNLREKYLLKNKNEKLLLLTSSTFLNILLLSQLHLRHRSFLFWNLTQLKTQCQLIDNLELLTSFSTNSEKLVLNQIITINSI